MGNPTRQAADGKQHGKHRHRNADRPIDNARIEIDVGIELALDKVFVLQRHLLQLLGDVEDGVVDLSLRQQLFAPKFL